MQTGGDIEAIDRLARAMLPGMPKTTREESNSRLAQVMADRGGWKTTTIPAGAPEMRSYDAPWQDKIAAYLIGDHTDPQYVRFINGLTGAAGVAGNAIAAPFKAPGEINDAAKTGDVGKAMLAALSAVPAAKGVGIAAEAAGPSLIKSLMAETPRTLRAGGDMAQAYLQRIRDLEGMDKPAVSAIPDAVKRMKATAEAAGLDLRKIAGQRRIFDEATGKYSFVPEGSAEARAAMVSQPDASDLGIGTRWMVNPEGKVENARAIPPQEIDKWREIYTDQPRKAPMSPDQMTASHQMWGSPSGSIWDQSYMPTEAPKGVKDAVAEHAGGKSWGAILTDLADKIKASHADETMGHLHVVDQLPAIATEVAASLAPQVQSQPMGALIQAMSKGQPQ